MIKQSNKKNIEQSVLLLRKAQIVAIPTETVYGLAGDACSDEAVARIYEIKGRPQSNPLICHVNSLDMAERVGVFDDRARDIAHQFWSGALTIVVPLSHRADRLPISQKFLAGHETVAIRCPNQATALQVISEFGGPIAAPSANKSGQISPTTPQHVATSLRDNPPAMILADGACQMGVESTILDLSTHTPKILRPGAITAEELMSVIPELHDKPYHSELVSESHATGTQAISEKIPKALCDTTKNENYSFFKRDITSHKAERLSDEALAKADISESHHHNPLKAPGMMTRHYAPNTPLRLNAVDVKVGEALLAFGPLKFMGSEEYGFAKDMPEHLIYNLSAQGDLTEAAHNLFNALHVLDRQSANSIAVMPIPQQGLGVAIDDRLQRAAAKE